jgi:succinyl-diaminopimelate desuccinylase
LDLGLAPAELALQLVDIPSVSGTEAPLADAVQAALAHLPHLRIGREGNALVASTELGRRTRVVVAGHLDTVPIKNNVPGRLADGVLWGRGAVDMKGGLAAMLSAAALLDAPHSDVTWVFYDNEEVTRDLSGLGKLIERHPDWVTGDFGILCEPTRAGLEGGCNGTLRVDVMARGQAAHSARPWAGRNAIHALVGALDRLVAFAPGSVRLDGLDYVESLSGVGLRGGGAGNVIPDEAAVTVNYRFAPDKSEAQALRIVEALFNGFEVHLTDSAPGAAPGLNHPLAVRLAGVVAAHGGAPPRAKLGWTDVARLAARGIPSVNLGPGDPALAHRDDEACPAEQIDQVRSMLVSFLSEPERF